MMKTKTMATVDLSYAVDASMSFRRRPLTQAMNGLAVSHLTYIPPSTMKR